MHRASFKCTNSFALPLYHLFGAALLLLKSTTDLTVCAERGWIESDRIQQLRILLCAALTLVDDVVANVMA